MRPTGVAEEEKKKGRGNERAVGRKATKAAARQRPPYEAADYKMERKGKGGDPDTDGDKRREG